MKVTLYLLAFAAAFFALFQLGDLTHKPPHSVHQWRQADGASMAARYAQDGLDFAHPRVHNLLGHEGKGVGELPLLYYVAGACYRTWGEHPIFLRGLSLLLWLSGLWALSQLLWRHTQDLLLSVAIPLWAWTAPMIAYYSYNFLPNVPALGLALLAWYAFDRYQSRLRVGWLWTSAALWALAGLLKVTALLTFVPLLAVYGLELLGLWRHPLSATRPRLYPHRWAAGLAWSAVVAIVAGWYLWAIQYNAEHHTTYFRTTSWAIWDMKPQEVRYTFKRILAYWRTVYFHDSSHLVVLLLTAWILATPRRQSPYLYGLAALTTIGVLLYGALWFYAFKDHDYYAINLLALPLIVTTGMAIRCARHHPQWLTSWGFKLSIVALLAINAWHARTTLSDRLARAQDYAVPIAPVLYERTDEVRAFLATHGLSYPTKVISIPDPSPNTSLYFLNLLGWTELYHQSPYDADEVRLFAGYGAEYLIINDPALLDDPALQPVLAQPVANFRHQLYVFDLRGLSANGK